MLKILIPRWKGLKHSWLARGPGVDYVWLGESCHYGRVCVSVCVCDVEQLECSTRTTEIFPRTSLYITQKPSDMPFSFFSCLFPELAYKLNHPQSHRAGILILKDLCCKAHCFAPLCFQPPRELYGRFS